MEKIATKAQAVTLKAAPSDEGVFEALVAVFGNIDAYGDVIVKGAFADTLKEWDASGFPIPVVWSHEKDDPFSHIGVVEEAKETDTGLHVRARLDLENPKAKQVHKLLKGGRVKEFSFAFGYDPKDVNPAKRDGVDVRELKRLKLYEVGPTMIGANPATQLLSVKSVKADDEGDTMDDEQQQPDELGDDQLEKLAEVRDELANLLTRMDDILEQNPDDEGPETGDDDEEPAADPSESGEASRSQTSDETHSGKSAPGSAERPAAIDVENLAALFAATYLD